MANPEHRPRIRLRAFAADPLAERTRQGWAPFAAAGGPHFSRSRPRSPVAEVRRA